MNRPITTMPFIALDRVLLLNI